MPIAKDQLRPRLTRSANELLDYYSARYSMIYVVSPEEARVEKELTFLAVSREIKLVAWSVTRGFVALNGTHKGGDVRDPGKALDQISAAEGEGIYLLRDMHAFLGNAEVVRRLRDLARDFREVKKTVVLLSPVLKIPPELEKELAVMDWNLPGRDEMTAVLQDLTQEAKSAEQLGDAATAEGRERLVEAVLGLTLVEARNTLAKSLVSEVRRFDIRTVLGEKKQAIRKSGILEYYEASEALEDIGGLEVLKDWLQKRRNAFDSGAREFGLPLPKGILLIGVPGCGKSLTAKAVGAAWQMPLLRLDVGKIFGGLVGASEENIRKAIKTAEAIAPAILWLDEMEKGFSGTGSSNMSDGGTTSRVFGTFVTWLQEKTAPVFVIATANNVHQLPPELLRKGRFDEIFFVDLPTVEERKQIVDIHLRKKGRDPSRVDLGRLVESTPEFSGSELEQVVVSALYEAFYHNPAERELTTEQLLHAAREIVPLSVTMHEGIASMRDWARTRARPASLAAVSRAQIAAKLERKLEV
jgi:SpoVK/Ycf46/Vps4 family AAA+-type ATPase